MQNETFVRRANVLLLALLLLVLLPSSALAHATLIDSDPADGAVVATAPKPLTLTFNEPVAPLAIKLVRPDGSIDAVTDIKTNGASLAVVLPELGDGTHLLSWRVASEDGHPIGGALVFSVGAPSAGELPALPDGLGAPERTAIWLVRVCLYAGLLLGIGGAFFLAAFAPDYPRRRWLAALIVAGAVAAPVSVALHGVDALGLTLSGALDPAAWRAGFATSYGAAATIAFIALLLGLPSLLLTGVAARRLLALVAMLGVGAALATTGHASAAGPQWLTRGAVFLHAVGVTFWTGALLPLAMLYLGGWGTRQSALRGFSRAIPFSVALIVLTGAILAIVQVQAPAALLSTAYGQILCLKLALVAILLIVAARNRWRLTRPALAGDERAGRSLGRAAAFETLLAVLIMALAAGWRFTPPPRVLAIEAAKPAYVHIHAGDAMADVTITPGRVGMVDIAIFPMLPDMTPIEAKEVEFRMSHPKGGIEPLRRKAERMPTGGWRVTGLAVPLAGVWDVRLDILVSDFDKLVLDAPVEIRP